MLLLSGFFHIQYGFIQVSVFPPNSFKNLVFRLSAFCIFCLFVSLFVRFVSRFFSDRVKRTCNMLGLYESSLTK